VTVSAVVPAYNEGPRVGHVVSALVRCTAVHQVIVVDDGSQDDTAEVAKSHGATVVSLPCNVGKGGAVARGVEAADGEIILLLDADLIGLTEDHIMALLEPVMSGSADMSVGLFDDGRVATDLAQAITPWLSGQRAVRREALAGLELDISRFGVEAVLTRRAKNLGLKVVQVKLPHLTHVMKEEKMGAVKGVTERAKMYWEVVKSLVHWE